MDQPARLRAASADSAAKSARSSIADCACGATRIRERRDEWIKAGIFAELKTIARECYDRIVGLVLADLAVDGCIAKAPGGGECAGRSPVDRGKLGMKRSLMVEGRGMTGDIAHKGENAPIQAGQRWHAERANAWHNAFNRLQRCYERNEDVIGAFFGIADAIITVRSLIRQAWTRCRWDTRPAGRP